MSLERDVKFTIDELRKRQREVVFETETEVEHIAKLRETLGWITARLTQLEKKYKLEQVV
jgi:hypothetical protein